MQRWIIPLLIASALIFVLEYYAFQAVKTVTRNRVIRWVWVGIGFLVYLNLLYVIFSTPSNSGQTKQFQMATGMMITILIPKLFGELFYVQNYKNPHRLVRVCCYKDSFATSSVLHLGQVCFTNTPFVDHLCLHLPQVIQQ